MDKFNNNEYGWFRNEDSLSSKWRGVNKACTEFLPIFNDIKDNWRSGANDDDIFKDAAQSYFNTYGKSFNMKDAFYFLKQHPKWNLPKVPVIRDREDFEAGVCETQGDPVSLSQDFEAELFGDVQMTRPIGRDKAKKAQKTSASSDAGASSRGKSSSSSRFEDFMDKMEEVASIKIDSHNKFNEYVKMKTALTHMDLLGRSETTLEDPEDKIHLQNLKRYVRSQMGAYNFPSIADQ
ncbi:uncharacterized protein [Rutidosis leptorrhynchoides]|uniref:uncharacterized protein n=1 Tax=Rutidosis leptorrhynchoides TaxID=125765 RepID=UPI003A995365